MMASMMGSSWSIIVAHGGKERTVTCLLLQRERNFSDADVPLI